MGKCPAEQRLAFLIPQVHHSLRTQVRRVAEVSAARGWKWQRALRLLWGWQAAAMAGHSLLASCLPQGHRPGQQLHQTNHTSSKLHMAMLCPGATLAQVGLWLLIPARYSDLPQSCSDSSCEKTFMCIRIHISLNMGVKGLHAAICTCK